MLHMNRPLYVNELNAGKQQACWRAHNHSLYFYFVLHKFLFKPADRIYQDNSWKDSYGKLPHQYADAFITNPKNA